MDQNFWGILIDGVRYFFVTFFFAYPAAAPSIVFSNIPGIASDIVVPAYYWVSPIIDLKVVGSAISLVLALEAIRAVIAIWRWILTVIPAAS